MFLGRLITAHLSHFFVTGQPGAAAVEELARRSASRRALLALTALAFYLAGAMAGAGHGCDVNHV